jgi:ABC-type lipoprotein export system ATPase subunit
MVDTKTAFNNFVISVKSIIKTYKIGNKTTNALNDISLDIHEGEFIAITGASGSGKTTLLQMIGGLDKPTAGNIIVNDVEISSLSDAKLSVFRNKTIGFVFQFFYLQPFLKLNKNIEVPGMFSNMRRADRKSRTHELLEQVGLLGQEDYFPKELSGGQIQRAAIARALFNKPKILLADEPTGNLDSANSDDIIKIFEKIRNELGTTIIIVTHNPEIASHADRIIQLRDGALI